MISARANEGGEMENQKTLNYEGGQFEGGELSSLQDLCTYEISKQKRLQFTDSETFQMYFFGSKVSDKSKSFIKTGLHRLHQRMNIFDLLKSV